MISQIHPVEIFEGIINIIVSGVFIIGLFATYLVYKKNKTPHIVFLMLLMFSGFLYSFSNIFEKFELWARADEFGDPFIVFFATILLIIGLIVILEEKIQTSEKKYRKAFKHATFYKDLFTHDMSNIVQNLKSSLELYNIKSNSPNKLKERDNLIEIIKEQSIRGEKLILKVRKISQIEEGEIKIVPVEVFTVLNETIKYIKTSFQNKTLNIQLDNPDSHIKIQANEFLTDVFENLLINAITYNSSKTVELLVRTSVEQIENHKYLKIEFLDNGIGISDERKISIFKRGHKSEKRTKGMGIGLSLVKEIVRAYNGEISIKDRVEDDYTKGSNFILKFPMISS